MKVFRHATIAAGLAALAMTAACSGADEPAPVETNVINLAEPENVVENATLVDPTPPANVTAAPADPGADFTVDEQTQDDADATGMTARVPRGEDNGTQPAE